MLLGPLFVRAIDFNASDFSGMDHGLRRAAILGAAAQLLIVSLKVLWLARSDVLELRASSLLLSGRLKRVCWCRWALLIGAGVVLPLVSESHAGTFAA